MLEFIRNNARSWIVKVLFGIIILVFVFWGVGSFRGDNKKILAEVNDSSISSKEFMRYHERRLRQLQQKRPNISQEELQKMDFKRRVFDQLVNRKLLLQKAKDLNLFVTSAELKGRITNMQAFANKNKDFDRSRYRSVLRANNMMPAQFENRMQQSLLQEKLQSSIAASVKPGMAEAKDLFDFSREKVKIEYIFYEQSDFLDKVELEEKEIKKYYEDNKGQFKQPEKMRIKYLLLTPASLAEYEDVSDKEIKQYYRANKDSFQQEKQVKARHILIKVPDTASEEKVASAKEKIAQLKNKLEQGADFASLAKKKSQGPSAEKGGSLGWIKKGEMVQSFEKAAFDLDSGEVSDPVKTQYGFHLIKVEDKRKKGVRPLKEVRDQVRQKVAVTQATGKVEDKLDKALDILLSTGDLNKAGEKIGAGVKKSNFFSRQKGPRDLDLDSEQIKDLFALQEKGVTNYPIMLKDGYLLAKNIQTKQAYIPDLERVRPAIEKKLREQKAKQMAQNKAKQDLEKILQNKDKGFKKLSREIKQSEPFNRRGPIPGLGSHSELIDRAFQAENKQWFSRPFELSSGYVLARLQEKIRPSKKAWEEQKSYLVSGLKRSKRQQLLNAYVEQLREDAQIDIISPQVLEY